MVGGMLILLAGCGGDEDGAGVAKPSAIVPKVSVAAGSTALSAGSTASTASTAVGQATLSWRAPETRVNGDVLSGQDLASYEIRYGMSANNLDRSALYDRAAGLIDMSYTIENLSAGTWFFTIQARDDNGLLSSPSIVVSKTIPS